MHERFYTALKLMAVFYAIFALLTAVADAVIGTPALDDLIFHSFLFHVLLFGTFLAVGWVVAPLLLKNAGKSA